MAESRDRSFTSGGSVDGWWSSGDRAGGNQRCVTM